MKNMRTLKEYLKTINKDKCPYSCEFKFKKRDIALVPPPKEISSILISRDPTTKWIRRGYEDAKGKPNSERREMLFKAIPESLIGQIDKFKRENIDIEALRKFIYEKVYWTHLHKCFTDAKNKFSCTNATRCADTWLTEELRLAIANNDIECIITLGNDVYEWIRGWKDINKIKIEIIKLPHPSRQNNRYWHRNKKFKDKREEMEKEIEKLMKLI